MYQVMSYPYQAPYGYIVKNNQGKVVSKSKRAYETEKEAQNAGDLEVPDGQQVKHGRTNG